MSCDGEPIPIKKGERVCTECAVMNMNGGSSICADETFPFKEIGNGYTVELTKIRLANDLIGDGNYPWTYRIPVLCIQVGQHDNDGYNYLKSTEAAALTTQAFEAARQEVFDQWVRDEITDPNRGAKTFIFEFRNNLLDLFSSTTVSTQSCNGDIPVSRPHFNFGGLCWTVYY